MSKSGKRKLHLVANAHLDPIWQWQWEEGAVEALSTFRVAVKHLRQFPEAIFQHNESLLYEWVEEYEPQLFEDIKQLVKEGRWIIVGGWYVQPDCNIPGGESFVRQGLVGKQYFKEKFGVDVQTAYNLDSFGHCGGLPQILSKSGYKYYIHCRPVPAERTFPKDAYIFRGVDGSEIIACRTSLGWYNTMPGKTVDKVRDGIKAVKERDEDLICLWGVGDHGGAPTALDLEMLRELLGDQDGVEVLHSHPQAYFDEVSKGRDSLPVIEGDIQRTFTGCYTSAADIKRGHRAAEGYLAQAERLATLANYRIGMEYPKAELDAAWKDHLFNEFHDILAGSSSEAGTKDGVEIYGLVNTIARRVRLRAALNLAKLDAPKVEGIPVYVFNPHSFTYRGPVEADFMIDYMPSWDKKVPMEVRDKDGNLVPSQEEVATSRLPFEWRKRQTFHAEVPPMSHSLYMVIPTETPDTTPSIKMTQTDGALVVENGRFKAELDRKTGLMSKLTDLETGKEVLSGAGISPIAVNDQGDCWGGGIDAYREIVGEFRSADQPVLARIAGYYEGEKAQQIDVVATIIGDPGQKRGDEEDPNTPIAPIRVLENGPVRAIVESVLAYGESTIVQKFFFYPNLPYFGLKLYINWNEPHRMLKVAVPTTMQDAKVICEVPYGAIERETDGTEHVGQRWTMLESGNYGVGLINTGQYGFDAKDGELRLSILRSPVYCHGAGQVLERNRSHRFMDIGEHEVTLGFTFGEKDEVTRDTIVAAQQMNVPAFGVPYFPKGPGDLPTGIEPQEPRSFLSVMPETVVLGAMKKAEDGSGIIVRLHESAGQETDTTLTLENGLTLEFNLGPYELKSYKISGGISDMKIEEVDLLERKLS